MSGTIFSSQERRFNRYKLHNNQISNNNLVVSNGNNENIENLTVSQNNTAKINEAINNNNNEENDSISASNSANNSQIAAQKKVPILLNNLQTMFDLNSERVRKRSEQMKKKKMIYDVKNETPSKNLENIEIAVPRHKRFTLPHTKPSLPILNILEMNRPNKIKLNKKFKEEYEDTHLEYNLNQDAGETNYYKIENLDNIDDDAIKVVDNLESANVSYNKNKSPSLSQNQSQINDTNDEYNEAREEAEVVVSDLDCEIDNTEDTNMLNTNIKSFIPLQNHLRSKRAISQDKATPSYLMALYQYEESDSNRTSLNNSCNDYPQLHAQDNSYNNSLGNIHGTNPNNYLGSTVKHNYIVNDIIEEETSENNTDNELSARKRYSLNFKSYRSNESNNHLKSPQNKRFTNYHSSKTLNKVICSNRDVRQSKSDGSGIKSNEVNYISNPYSNHHSNESGSSFNSTPIFPLRKNKYYHKNSKSEFINFRVDMKKMIEKLEKRRQMENEERKEKLKLRKNILLNKFFKSNSHQNLPYNFGSGIDGEKKLMINTPNSLILDSILKKLSPSGASRAFYYDYNYSNNNNYNNNFQIKESTNYLELNENNFINFEDGDVSRDNSCDIIENKSIVEIKDDEDVNFETELNIQLEKNDLMEDIEAPDQNNENFNENHIELVENEAFAFNVTPIEMKKNIDRKKSVFDSEDMKISQGDKFNIVNDIIETSKITRNLLSNFENNINNSNLITCNLINNNTDLNFSAHFLKNSSFTQQIHSRSQDFNNKSVLFNTSNNMMENTIPLKQNNLEVTPNIKIQIISSSGDPNKNVFNNNYINNNINNISISIVNGDSNSSTIRKMNKQKNNSMNMTNDIRQKYIGSTHLRQPGINIIKASSLNEMKARSNSFSKNKANNHISIHAIQNYIDPIMNHSLKVKKSPVGLHSNQKQSIINTPKKNKYGASKGDLKHFLIYSDTKDSKESFNLNNNFNINSMSNLSSFNNTSSNFINFVNLNNNFYSDNNRVNSETSVKNNSPSSNKKIIQDALKILRFQYSSLDHQRFTLDKLAKSKSKFFCLLIASDNYQANFEYKGLYEINLEKNSLTKIYSVNYYPHNIEFNEIKHFYFYDSDCEKFKTLTDVKRFSPDIHGFYMQYNYKKFLKA